MSAARQAAEAELTAKKELVKGVVSSHQQLRATMQVHTFSFYCFLFSVSV